MAAWALESLTLKATRSGEVRGMTWEEVDLGGRDSTGKYGSQSLLFGPFRQRG